MPQKYVSTNLEDWIVESSPVLEVAAGIDPFLDFAAIDSDADNWLELLAYTWGIDGLEAGVVEESDRLME